jgi:hypothetical protein
MCFRTRIMHVYTFFLSAILITCSSHTKRLAILDEKKKNSIPLYVFFSVLSHLIRFLTLGNLSY